VLLGLRSYREFRERFPWAVAPAPGAAKTSEAEFSEAVRRLTLYGTMLAELGRPRPLARGENPYLDIVGLLALPFPEEPDESDEHGHGEGASGWALSPGLAQLLDIPTRRRELADRFAWAIPSASALDTIARHGPLVEGGAGRGYWAALLRGRGADIAAFDPTAPGPSSAFHREAGGTWTDVVPATTIEAVRRHRDRTLFLCWPPHDDDAASFGALRAYRGAVLVYVGEGRDGASGTLRFHRELALNWSATEIVGVSRWPGIADRLVVYRRNPVRRRHAERDRCFECGRFLPTGGVGRCDSCVALRPAALAVRVGEHRVEYPASEVEAMPPGLRRALERSPNRIA